MKFTVVAGLVVVSTFLLTGCGGGSHKVEQVSQFNDTFVYDETSQYKDVLLKCIKASYTNESCSLEKLPFLKQTTTRVTKDDIKKRLVVSHKWMGDRFLEMLDLMDSDILELLGATTAIVIDNDIRPSFYWNLTGAIYIDPRYLWLTPEEASSITKQDDYRSDFGKDLNFLVFWRYVKDNSYAYHYYNLDSNVTRTKASIEYRLASLLYHELAHANDYFPDSQIDNINTKLSAYNALSRLKDERISTNLTDEMPLESDMLDKLGQVLFHGTKATSQEKSLTAQDVGEEFDEAEGVSMYSYSTKYEDLAMLFETTMMRYHYNIKRDQAFIVRPDRDENLTCRDYIVGWGVRDKLSEEGVKVRAKYVAKRILPSVEWDNFFDNNLTTSPELMDNGKDWCENLDLSSDKKLLKSFPQNRFMLDDMSIPE